MASASTPRRSSGAAARIISGSSCSADRARRLGGEPCRRSHRRGRARLSDWSYPPMITVLIADDHVVVRRGLLALIAEQPDLELVARGRRRRDRGRAHARALAGRGAARPVDAGARRHRRDPRDPAADRKRASRFSRRSPSRLESVPRSTPERSVICSRTAEPEELIAGIRLVARRRTRRSPREAARALAQGRSAAELRRASDAARAVRCSGSSRKAARTRRSLVASRSARRP